MTAKLNAVLSTTAFKTYPSHHVKRKNKCLDYQQMALKSNLTQWQVTEFVITYFHTYDRYARFRPRNSFSNAFNPHLTGKNLRNFGQRNTLYKHGEQQNCLGSEFAGAFCVLFSRVLVAAGYPVSREI